MVFNIKPCMCVLSQGNRYDFSLIDRANKAGWDLAVMLLSPRSNNFRGRPSASVALRHRFFNS
jgi:hypothetical protein